MAEIREHDAMGCRACGREERASEGYPCADVRHVHLPDLHLPRRDAAAASAPPRRPPRRDGAVIARAAIAPIFAEPTLRAEQVEPARAGRDRRRARDCRASGGRSAPSSTATSAGSTRATAPRWTMRPRMPGARTRPLGATVPRCGWGRSGSGCRFAPGSRSTATVVRLPDGRRAGVHEGRIATADETVAAARAQAPEHWALEHFAGSPYEWGGVTPYGVDCSGLVQTTFLARGLSLPRDRQPAGGLRRALCRSTHFRPGDLLFFRGETDAQHHARRVRRRGGHAGPFGRRRAAGVVQESWLPGSRAATLRDRLVAVRRLEDR